MKPTVFGWVNPPAVIRDSKPSQRKQSFSPLAPQLVALKKLCGDPPAKPPTPSHSVLAATGAERSPPVDTARNGKSTIASTPVGGAGNVDGTRSTVLNLLVMVTSK